MTNLQQKIIKIYEDLTETRIVRPSYRVVAKKADSSVGTAFQVIKAYLKKKDVKSKSKPTDDSGGFLY